MNKSKYNFTLQIIRQLKDNMKINSIYFILLIIWETQVFKYNIGKQINTIIILKQILIFYVVFSWSRRDLHNFALFIEMSFK